MLVLAVEGEQPATEQFQVGGGGGATGDEGSGPPRSGHATPQDNLLCALRQPRSEVGHLRLVEQPLGQVEDALHPGLLRPRPDDLWSCLAAHQQVERVGQHRLAGAGLAGDRVEPLAQAQLGLLDQEQVLDPELAQHAVLLALGAAGPLVGWHPPCPARCSGQRDVPTIRVQASPSAASGRRSPPPDATRREGAKRGRAPWARPLRELSRSRWSGPVRSLGRRL